MTTKTHIDTIRATEKEAVQIIEKAQKEATKNIAEAKKRAQESMRTYAENVAQVQKKRTVSQEQQLREMTTKIRMEAEDEAKALEDTIRPKYDGAVEAIAQRIMSSVK